MTTIFKENRLSKSKLVNMISAFPQDMKLRVNFGDEFSDVFTRGKWVKQELDAPTTFAIYVAVALSHAFQNSKYGIYINIEQRNDFDFTKLKFITMVVTSLIRYPLQVPDCHLVSHSEMIQQSRMHLIQRVMISLWLSPWKIDQL